MKPNYAVTDVRQTPNYSPGRPYGAPNQIVVHHWGVDGQSHEGVVQYLCNPNNHGASAHYVVSAGRITQLCSDGHRTWHAGRSGNPRGIGIECRPEMSSGDVAALQKLIAAIRSEHGNLPVVGHRDHMATACPGRYYGILRQLNDGTAAGGSGSEAAPESFAKPTSEAYRTGYGYITVDGVNGPETWSRLRRVIGVWYPRPWAEVVANLQQFLKDSISLGQMKDLIGGGLSVDAEWGPKTTKALQWYLWHNGPNLSSKPPSHVWRKFAPGWGLWDFVTGQMNEATVAVLQEALNYSEAETGKLMTWRQK